MAVLHNEAKNLRLFIDVVDREVLPVIPGAPPPEATAARLLGTGGVEFFDRRDKDFWPFIRLPVLYLQGTDGIRLIESIRNLCALKVPGFVFRTGVVEEFVVQIGRLDDKNYVVDIGIDLAPYLHETSGQHADPGKELSMFRFQTTTAELVTFADQMKAELDKLRPVKAER